MAEIKLQAFVSSTYEDLKEEREAAVEAILNAEHIPAGMELFKAGKSQLETIYKWIDDSDIYLLILGGRYGSIEQDSQKSYLELEYDYALKKGKPIFAIVLTDDYLHRKAAIMGEKAVFEQKNKDKYKKFKKLVMSKIVYFSDTVGSIKEHIARQLLMYSANKKNSLTGWIKNDEHAASQIFDSMELKELVSAKEKLNENITKNIIDSKYRSIADDFMYKYEKMLLETLKQQTFIERFNRNIRINLDKNNKALITMKTEIQYTNVENNRFYRSSPVFPERWQAESYVHRRFIINDGDDCANQIETKVVENEDNDQFHFRVQNSYPIDICEGNVKIFHKVAYTVDIRNFCQFYSVRYPCRDFHVSIHLSGEDADKYRIVMCLNEYFNINTYLENTRVRDKKTCSITFPHWILSGSGYGFTIQPDKK